MTEQANNVIIPSNLINKSMTFQNAKLTLDNSPLWDADTTE